MFSRANKEVASEILSNYSITANIGISEMLVARYGKVVMVSVTIAPASTGWITIASGLPAPIAGAPNTAGTSDRDGHPMSNICRVIHTGELLMYVTDQGVSTYTITYICK